MRDITALTKKLYDAVLDVLLTDASYKLPTRRFIAQGLSAWDQEQFTVSFMSLGGGQPSGQEQYQPVQDMVFYGDFRIEIVRKAPTASGAALGPPAAVQEKAADATNDDVLALLNAMQTVIVTFAVVPVGVQFILTGVSVLGPEGGMCGVVGECQIALI